MKYRQSSKTRCILLLLCWVYNPICIAAYEPAFSTGGFFALDHAGREVFSMNAAWHFHNKSSLFNSIENPYLYCYTSCDSQVKGREYFPIRFTHPVKSGGEAYSIIRTNHTRKETPMPVQTNHDINSP